MNLVTTKDFEHFQSLILENILRSFQEGKDRKSFFNIALTGGETVKPIYIELAKRELSWKSWNFFFGDERCAEKESNLLNETQARELLLNEINISEDQIFSPKSYLGVFESARYYNEIMNSNWEMDLVLLGLGEDGHIASLFPGFDVGENANSPDVIAVLDAPKAPPNRISFSLNKLQKSRQILIVAKGKVKGRLLMEYELHPDLPVSRVLKLNQTRCIFLDCD